MINVRSEKVEAAAKDAAQRTAEAAGAAGDAADDVMDAAKEGAKEVTLAAKDRVSLGGVEVSPLGVGAWAWGDTLFWGYSEAMDKELQEVRIRRRQRLRISVTRKKLQRSAWLCVNEYVTCIVCKAACRLGDVGKSGRCFSFGVFRPGLFR